MSRRLSGKTAIVTGAGNGIGLAIARRLARDGTHLVIAELDADTGAAAAEQIRANGGYADFLQTDVTNERAVNDLIDWTVQQYGRVDILVNNVGRALRRPFMDTAFSEWQHMLDLNLSSMFLCAHAAHPHLAASNDGVIVNIASMHAFYTVPGVAAYAAAKGGVVALTRSLALEFAPQIRVNAVAPGLIETDAWLVAIQGSEEIRQKRRAIHPLGRIGRPEDIAGAVAFLAGQEASFITGAILPVDGGLTAQLYRE